MYKNFNSSHLKIAYLDNNSAENFTKSTLYLDESYNNETKVSTTEYQEVSRLLHVAIRPFLIVLGTYGNTVSFYIMRRGSLKEVSTCFYMAMLAIADTCEYKLM